MRIRLASRAPALALSRRDTPVVLPVGDEGTFLGYVTAAPLSALAPAFFLDRLVGTEPPAGETYYVTEA